MKPNDFAYYLSGFLTKYLPNEIGASSNTIASYRDTFILLLEYLREEEHITAEKLTLAMIQQRYIVEFLNWIEQKRHCRTSTRNIRLAAIHSFFRYLQYENPDNLAEWQRILAIPAKKSETRTMNYMTIEGITLLLTMPDTSTRAGRRDLALLSLMYDTAARVQEIADLTPSCIRFEHPCTIKLVGKGRKARIVPLMGKEASILKRYMEENQLMSPAVGQYPLFCNNHKDKLTRIGIGYILSKYSKMAKKANTVIIPENLSCHSLRHSKAMHLLQAGVNLVYIRDILGHSSVQTTEIYARVDSKQKRMAIEHAYVDVMPTGIPIWQTNDTLLEWLRNFNR